MSYLYSFGAVEFTSLTICLVSDIAFTLDVNVNVHIGVDDIHAHVGLNDDEVDQVLDT